MDLNDLPETIQHTVAFAEDMTGDQRTNRSTLTVQQPVLTIPEHERKSYPTDLTDSQWQRIVPLLPPAEPKGRQNGVELREVINGLLYVICGSHDWRSFPRDLPPRRTVYSYFRQWQPDGTLQRVLDALCSDEYETAGHFAPFRHALSAYKTLTRKQAVVLSIIMLGCGLGLLFYGMKLSMISFTVLLISLVFFAQSIFSLYLMLYSWEHPERLEASRGPCSFLPPQLSFTVLLPARHEEAVIYETIKRVWAANYPSDLLEIVVICHIDDTGTIAEAQRAIREIDSSRVRVVTFCTPPINKPRGLNAGFQQTSNQVVTIFDAEDDMDSNIFNVVNTIMLEEKVGIVQAGVQLMNFRDHWFAIHNCVEYFFWFKSRLHFHAKVGMIPLGGNTVFFRRDLIERIGGWDEYCLTEDADIGLRLSGLGEPIRVVYDKQHISREETPPTVASFIRQRTRWQQGFLQVLRKGSWLALPRLSQRLLAISTLSYPFLQALLALLWLPAIVAVLWLKLPVLVAMISFLPLYALFLQFLATIVGAFAFTREYGSKFPLFMPISMSITFLPYQYLLGISAIRAIYRELRQMHNWEKTEHAGAHRKPEIVSFNSQAAIDAETYDQEGAIR
jgi:cellulose synthase/poly-beta-1,6-N-acetylglucosamine synthase-like glycosyltransferase/transposase